ncbi:hypothetical protein [Paracoccus mutanolyticus]|uniref:hypothetical protein n=1 Tax=Paracoccus mutanolyticus TaxID=1499308 RepID=UPI0011AE203F|nr:hypothetical protein [Paracoccus mutanolyticus]
MHRAVECQFLQGAQDQIVNPGNASHLEGIIAPRKIVNDGQTMLPGRIILPVKREGEFGAQGFFIYAA